MTGLTRIGDPAWGGCGFFAKLGLLVAVGLHSAGARLLFAKKCKVKNQTWAAVSVYSPPALIYGWKRASPNPKASAPQRD